MVSLEEVLNDGFGANMTRAYVPRPDVDELLAAAMRSSRHVAIFGTSGVGKSTLVRSTLDASQLLQVRCLSGQSAPDLYRSILSEAGAKVRTETRLTKKRRLTATLRLVGGDTERASETTEADVTIDLGNVADVLRTLRLHDRRSFVVLNDFHLLSRGTQRRVLGDLQYMFEETPIRVIMVGVWTASAYLTDLDESISSFVADVPVRGWSDDELGLFLKHVETMFTVQFSDEVREVLVRTSAGSIRDLRDLVRRFLYDLRIASRGPSLVHVDDADRLQTLVLQRRGRLNARYRNTLMDYLTTKLHSLEDVDLQDLVVRRLNNHLSRRYNDGSYTAEELKAALREIIDERNAPRILEQRRRMLILTLLSDAAKRDASSVSITFDDIEAACPADLPTEPEDLHLSAKTLMRTLSAVRPRPIAFDPNAEAVVALEPAFRSFLASLPADLDEYAEVRLSRVDDKRYWRYPRNWDNKVARRAEVIRLRRLNAGTEGTDATPRSSAPRPIRRGARRRVR